MHEEEEECEGDAREKECGDAREEEECESERRGFVLNEREESGRACASQNSRASERASERAIERERERERERECVCVLLSCLCGMRTFCIQDYYYTQSWGGG
jgi:hypothetical protein